MQCYTELVPPTAVNASLSLPFLSATANNLIVARNSLLQIFAPKSVVTDASSEQFSTLPKGQNGQKKERIHTTKLVLISQFHVPGTITDLARVKAQKSKSGGELLLVALKDAKLSLVEWDPEKHSISTVSIHYYEREDLQGAPWAPYLGQCVNVLSVDASSRCAAFKFGPRNLAILPFHQAGDDLAIDDLEMDADSRGRPQGRVNGDTGAHQTPYASSFVLSLLALDPALKFPIHMAFLQGYREPTLAMLSSQQALSAGMLHERQDIVSLTVYTMELDQRASTTLLSVTGLPYDIHRIHPLPAPIGGALLLGYNEIIHVDQGGKTNGIAVNDFAKDCTSYPLVQRTELDLKLENCVVEQLGTSSGDVLIVLGNGELAVLSFKLDGRTVSGLDIYKITAHKGGALLDGMASCASTVGRGRLFIGSEDCDSVIVGWSARGTLSTNARNGQLENGTAEEDLDLDMIDDDQDDLYENDLYSEARPDEKQSKPLSSPTFQSSEDFTFRVHDKLTNLAPLTNVQVIGNGDEKPHGPSSEGSSANLVATTGNGKSSSLIRLSPEVSFSDDIDLGIHNAQRAWSIRPDSESTDKSDIPEFIITSTEHDFETSESRVYSLQNNTAEEVETSDFEVDAGASIEVTTFMSGTQVLQILASEVRIFDAELNLSQIVPLSDEPGSSPITAASIVEPYVVLLREDKSIVVLQANDEGELEILEKSGPSAESKWISGSLYDDVNDAFHLEDTAGDEEDYSSMLLFLLDTEGGLQIFRLPRLQDPIYTAPGLALLPPYLAPGFNIRRATARAQIDEILVAALGDATFKSPHLILRSASEDLIIYSPYQDTSRGSVNKSLQFRKIPHPYLPKAPPTLQGQNTASKAPLRVINDTKDQTFLVMPGYSATVVAKTASSDPVLLYAKPGYIQSIAHRISEDKNNLVYVDEDGKVHLASLPTKADYTTGWVSQTILSSSRITGFDYHEQTDKFIIGISEQFPYRLPEDELHPEWQHETATFLPTMEQDAVNLVDGKTLSIVDTLELEPQEVVMCIKTMTLEVSEHTHEKRSLVCVSTAITRGEEINTFGCIYIIDIIDVVPEPDRPETSRKFKVLSKVRDKGAVTAITSIGTEGFLLVCHGQKGFVRGLKEDGTLLPVAFIDTQGYVTVAKELPKTGMTLLTDAMKGVWFVGYTEDPYHLKMLGKADNHLQVHSASFLPDNKDLYMPVLDSTGILHIFQYDPSNPKSLAGHNLLHLSSLHTGSYPASSMLLPRPPTSWQALATQPTDPDTSMDIDTEEQPSAAHQVLLTALDGSISLLTTLSPVHYRSLGALQSYLATTLPHPLALNPKGYRAIEADLSVGGRAVLDGNVLRRWMELGAWKKGESVHRAGAEEEWEVRAALEAIGVAGLGFL